MKEEETMKTIAEIIDLEAQGAQDDFDQAYWDAWCEEHYIDEVLDLEPLEIA